MKFLRRLIQIDKHQKLSNSGYECEQFDLPSKLAEVPKLILYLYAKDLCSYKTSSRTVWAQSFSPNKMQKASVCWVEVENLHYQTYRKEEHRQVSSLPSLPPSFPVHPHNPQSLVFTSEFPRAVLSQTSSTFCFFATDFCIHIPLRELETS